jgi:alkyl hydroperoxide reductase subunit AhpF
MYDMQVDTNTAKQYRVDKALAFVVATREGWQGMDAGIQYASISSGHEFATLIQDIILVSCRDSGLRETIHGYLKSLQSPLCLHILVTPHLHVLPAGCNAASPNGYGESRPLPLRTSGIN